MASIAEKTLTFLRCTGELLKRSQVEKTAAAQQREAVQAKIPAVVDALVAGERIYGHQKEAVAKALTDHGAALDLLADLAKHRNASEIPAIGTPSAGQTKSAAVNTGGRISNHDETEAGRRFRERLLGGATT